MALSELPPPLDEDAEGNEPPAMRNAPAGPMSRAWVQRLRTVDAPWTEARRARREAVSGRDESPIVLASAKGSNVVDLDGNRYVDFAAGFGAALLGHGDARVARTIELQSSRLVFGLGDVFPSDSKIGLTERLSRLFPEEGARVMLGCSGADAIDAALKTSVLATKRPGVVAFEGGYHGLSTGPLAVNGLRPEFRAPFSAVLSPHVRFAPFPRGGDASASLTEVENQCRGGSIGAIVVEPVLGRGGVVMPPPGFLASLRELADRYGALLVVDEIWTGLGRSGSMLRVQAEGVVPDIVCLGKGLGGGLPVSACVGRGKVMEAWRGSDAEERLHGEAIHTATHFGNPLGCATAIAVLDGVIGRKLADRSREEGARFMDLLRDALAGREVREVRGVGLMVGVHFEGGATRTLRIARDLLARGYITLTGGAGDVLTLTPPLTISRGLLESFVETLAEVSRGA